MILDDLNAHMAMPAQPAHSDTSSSEESSEDSSSANTIYIKRRSGSPLKFKEKHRLLKLRLGPLRRIQSDIERALGSAAIEVTEAMAGIHSKHSEFSIIASNGWKSAFDKLKSVRGRAVEANPSMQLMKDSEDDILDVIAECREDMIALWTDPIVREMLSRRKSRIEDSPGLYVAPILLLQNGLHFILQLLRRRRPYRHSFLLPHRR